MATALRLYVFSSTCTEHKRFHQHVHFQINCSHEHVHFKNFITLMYKFSMLKVQSAVGLQPISHKQFCFRGIMARTRQSAVAAAKKTLKPSCCKQEGKRPVAAAEQCPKKNSCKRKRTGRVAVPVPVVAAETDVQESLERADALNTQSAGGCVEMRFDAAPRVCEACTERRVRNVCTQAKAEEHFTAKQWGEACKRRPILAKAEEQFTANQWGEVCKRSPRGVCKECVRTCREKKICSQCKVAKPESEFDSKRQWTASDTTRRCQACRTKTSGHWLCKPCAQRTGRPEMKSKSEFSKWLAGREVERNVGNA